MDGSFRTLVITSVVVGVFCAAVSFGPALLLASRMNATIELPASQAGWANSEMFAPSAILAADNQ
jgi:hypothetical protein